MTRLLVSCAVLLGMFVVAPAAPAMLIDPVAHSAQACSITGTGGANRLSGTAGDDRMCGLGGGDRIRGQRGHDVLLGGAGGDLLQGKNGRDRLLGGSGNDRVFGGGGADDLRGGAGRDALGGGLGADELSGGRGRDIAYFGQKALPVRVTIGAGANDGTAGEGDDVHADVEDIQTGAGNDVVRGSGGSNRLIGDDGNDQLFGRRGSDVLMGGDGNDRLDARESAAAAGRAAQAGSVDRVVCGGGNDTAFVDPVDVVDPGCENVVGAAGSPPPPSVGNRPPTGIALSGTTVSENQQGGALVGRLSAGDPDPGDTHAFALVPGEGSDDNSSFQIVNNNELRTAANSTFDYESKSSYKVRIRASDFGTPAGQIVRAFTITVGDANEKPTDLELSGDTLPENEPAGTEVGELTVSDVDAGQSHAFTLVAGAGDNSKFAIDGSTLETAEVLDFETDTSYEILVRATDNGTPALWVEQAFTVTVTDTQEPPTPQAVDASTDEDVSVTVTLTATDPEGGNVDSFDTDAESNGTVGTVGAITCSGGTPNVCTADVQFTPDANFNGEAGFTYSASEGAQVSAPSTVSITVNPINDVPAAGAGTRSTNEDAAVSLDLGALVSDVETADGDLDFDVVTDPEHGTVTGTTYTPDANYNGPDTFTYQVTDRGDPDNCSGAQCDGSETSMSATVSIVVAPVNDVPTAGGTSVAVDEDGSQAVDLAALAGDLETSDANLAYTITQPENGTVTGTGASRTYTPGLNVNGSDSFTYTVTDRGDPDSCSAAPCDAAESATGTVSITVNAVNDAPVNTLPAGPLVALPNANTAISGVSMADVDAGTGAVQVTLSVTSGTLTVSPPLSLTVTGNGSDEVVVTGNILDINAMFGAPNGLVFNGAASTTLTVATSDLGLTGSGGAQTDTDTVQINVNTPPAAANLSPSTNEDTAVTVTLSASDADGDASSFAIATGPANGTLGAIGAVTCNALTPKVCTANVVYTPNSNFSGTDSFTYTANDGNSTSAPAMVSITVTPVNDVPRLENIEGGALAYTENDAATAITATTTVTDVDGGNFDTGTLTVDYLPAAPATADDRLTILTQGQITVSGSTVSFAGTAVGSFTGGTGTSALVVTLNANATPTSVQALVRAIAYSNVSDNPSTAARTVRMVLTDGDGGTSAAATRAINLTAVNDPPVLAAIESTALAYTENDPATAITSSLTVTDQDSNLTGATVTLDPATLAPAQDELAFVNTAQITGNYVAATGTLTLTGNATPAAYQSALRAVTYRNSSENPSTLTRTATFRTQDAAAQSNTQARNITVTAVNDAPTADNETFTGDNGAIGNTSLVVNDPSDGAPTLNSPKKSITGDILDGDSDIDGPGPLTVTAGTFTTSDGGSVTIEADGDFIYINDPLDNCTDTSDSFTYTVSDQNTAGPGPTPGTATGTVTISVAGCLWYVNNTAAAGNGGTSLAPFNTLAAAETESLANHTVFVFDGDNSSTGYGGDGYAMNSGERLIGEHAGLTVDPDGSGGPLAGQTLHPANPGAHPTLTATAADVISLDDANEVRGLNLDPQGTGGGIAGGTGDVSGTIDDVNINDTGTFGTQPGLELDTTTGTFAVSNFTVNTNGATGVRLNNAGTVTFAPTGTISITTAGAAGLDAGGTTLGMSTFDTVNVTSSGTGGVSIANAGSSTTTFGDLSLTTTSGATPAFRLTSAGAVSVPAAGTANLSATGGPAVDVTGTTVNGATTTTLAFDAVSSTTSVNDGINLADLGAGTFSAASGTITGAGGIAFDLDGGTGNVTYPGTIGNGPGNTAEITGRTGGTVTLSGPITESGDADGTLENGGIAVTGNTGGATVVSNATKTFNTGEDHAIVMGSSDGHALTVSGGTLDVDTTTGKGLEATSSGILNLTGASNTIDTGAGKALNVSDTDVGSTPLTLQRVSSNGANGGITLSNTGTNAALTVTGNGGTCTNADTSGCSGGVIQNTTGADSTAALPAGTGVLLNNTRGISLTRLHIHDHQNYGIRGSSVTGFTLADSVLNGTNGTSDVTNVRDSSVRFVNLAGTVSVTNADISGGYTSNFSIDNDSGALSSTFTGNDFGSVSTAGGDDSLHVIGIGTSEVDATVQNGTFNSARGDIFQYAGNGTGGGDLAFTGNTVTNTHPAIATGGGGITISGAAAGPETINVSNNTMRDAHTHALTVVKSQGTGSLTGTINNNQIGDFVAPLDPNAGSLEGAGIEVTHFGGGGNVTLNITNNQIRQYNSFGMSLVAGAGVASGGQFNLNISGNTISNEGTNPNVTLFQGIGVNSGVTPGDTFQTCVNFGANSIAGAGSDTITDSDFRIRARQNTTVRLPGYAGGATDGAAAATFVEGKIGGGAQGTAAAFDSGTFIGTGTTCP